MDHIFFIVDFTLVFTDAGYTDTGQGIDPDPDTCFSSPIGAGDCSSRCGSDSSSQFLKHSQRQWHDFKVLEDRYVY